MQTVNQYNFLERAISFISPSTALRRFQYRQALQLYSSKRSYYAASGGRRTQNWIAQSTSAVTEIQTALSFLRNRSRDLVRNNGYAKKAVTEIANNLVGTGITPTIIGKTHTQNQSKKIQDIFKAWADSTEADYDGHLNYWGIQHLAAWTMAESGEVLIRKHINANPTAVFPLQLQVLEPDFIDTTKFNYQLDGGGYIYYGVEFNKDNQIIAYWLWDHHPGDQIQINITSRRVPATDIIHLFKKERPGQFRGVPFGHAAMLRLKDLEEFEDTQLIRQKIAACFTAFRRSTGIVPVQGVNASTNVNRLEKVEPGIIEDLAPGEEITFGTPPDAGQNYDPYTKSILRGIAAAYGIDYVTLTGDLTAVNFSSGRMGWLQFHRNISVWQWHTFIPTVCNKTWLWFIQMAYIQGNAKTNIVPVSWTTPRREMIDPAKEMQAMIDAINNNLMSWQETIREMGYNPDDVLAQIAADKQSFTDLKLDMEYGVRFKGIAPAKPDQPINNE
jgi:lambda family phage portal protein